jgi:hypothetical protein
MPSPMSFSHTAPDRRSDRQGRLAIPSPIFSGGRDRTAGGAEDWVVLGFRHRRPDGAGGVLRMSGIRGAGGCALDPLIDPKLAVRWPNWNLAASRPSSAIEEIGVLLEPVSQLAQLAATVCSAWSRAPKWGSALHQTEICRAPPAVVTRDPVELASLALLETAACSGTSRASTKFPIFRALAQAVQEHAHVGMIGPSHLHHLHGLLEQPRQWAGPSEGVTTRPLSPIATSRSSGQGSP